MKERPILFSGPMVRAILSGRKTQTRRVVNPQPIIGSHSPFMIPQPAEGGSAVVFTGPGGLDARPVGYQKPGVWTCSYGKDGDRLWVKETFFDASKWRHAPLFAAAPDFIYRADYEYRDDQRSVIGCHHWKPSIFMTREASRISLKIVSVRVERLQEISEADAIAEGIEQVKMPTGEVMYDDYLEPGAMVARPVSSYASLWDKINGGGAWNANPWVWVVKFERVGGAV